MARSKSFAIIVALAAGCAPSGGNAVAPSTDGSSLDFSLPDLEGSLVSPGSESGEDVFVLAFWATWCQPCQQELTKMNGMYETRKDRGLEIYAIAIDGPDTVAQVGPWAQREGYNFPVLLDRETQVLTRYNPRGDIPYYVVLDAHGKILKDHQGYMTGDMVELEQFLDGVLTPPS